MEEDYFPDTHAVSVAETNYNVDAFFEKISTTKHFLSICGSTTRRHIFQTSVFMGLVLVLLLQTKTAVNEITAAPSSIRKVTQNDSHHKSTKKKQGTTLRSGSPRIVASKQERRNHELLLSVPYYVYEDLVWKNATFFQKNISDSVLNHIQPIKHHDDYWMMLASLRHPMRTDDPSKAKLFFIPALMNHHDATVDLWDFSRQENTFCWNGLCRDKLMAYTANILNSSEWYNKYPERHIAVASFYSSGYSCWHEYGRKHGMKEILSNIHLITFEDGKLVDVNEDISVNSLERLRLPKYYVGTACVDEDEQQEEALSSFVLEGDSSTNGGYSFLGNRKSSSSRPTLAKQHDLTMIATMRPNDPKRKDRSNICDWVQEFNDHVASKNNGTNENEFTSFADAAIGIQRRETKTKPIDMPVCGRGTQCPALGQAKFGFHVRGDTWGSNRLMDLLLSGTVPIFTHQEQYNVLCDWIDWKRLSFYLPLKDIPKELFWEKLQTILNDEEGYQQRYETILASRHLFDHETIFPFDQFMHRLQIEIYPETKHRAIKIQNQTSLPFAF